MEYEDYREGKKVWVSILWWHWDPCRHERIIESIPPKEFWVMRGVLEAKSLDVLNMRKDTVILDVFKVGLDRIDGSKFYQYLSPDLCHETEKDAYNKIRSLYEAELVACNQHYINQLESIKQRICEIEKQIEKG